MKEVQHDEEEMEWILKGNQQGHNVSGSDLTQKLSKDDYIVVLEARLRSIERNTRTNSSLMT